MIEEKYPHIFRPLELGNVTLRNRIIAAPTGSPAICAPEYLKRESAAFYQFRAMGGAAVVTLGDSVVDSKYGLMHPHKTRLDDPCVVPSLSNTSRYIAQYGAIPSLELQHGGNTANTGNSCGNVMSTDTPTYGPDHGFNEFGKEIFEMPQEIIRYIVECYGSAARTAKECGFQMLCIHGGHGWLLHQFISPTTNHRTDGYGGTVEKRCRFALEVIDAVRSAVGPGFPIEFRMSGHEYTPEGYGIEEAVEIAKLIAPKVDLLQVSAGYHENPTSCTYMHPSMFREHGCNVWLAEEIKKHVSTPVATIGGINDPAMIEDILASGKADVVEMSRALIADPFLPRKIREGRENEIRKCVRCLLCHHQTDNTKRNIRCTVNPVIGRELEHMNAFPPTEAKKVLVVGGGPGGLQAALTAAERGHSVTLCEAEDRLGGMLNYEEFVPFKKELYEFAQQLGDKVRKAGVEIHLNTRVDAAMAEAFAPDVLVCAVGSDYVLPPIPGIDKPNVLALPALRNPEAPFGRKVVILGGGLVGCETAIHLMRQGRQVTVVEMSDHFGTGAPGLHKDAIAAEFALGVELRLNTRALRIVDEGVICEGPEGEELLEADSIFCATGLRARKELRDELRRVAPRFIAVGNCVKPEQVFQAVSYAYWSALDI